MASETSSSVDELAVASVVTEAVAGGSDTRGKHRILAQLKRVDQDSRFLEEELEELQKTENVSTLCEELLRHIEMVPDPLLPLTNGPVNPLWDQWFEGPVESQGCRCSIL
ncbi:Guanine nucleotide-binding protein subunit gamma 1 [Morella rubra]|uniref:Guanine nucleotide-binding protein subunit gamma 1 n=1 Tax=Morella rubra TaxID=262757 RepID=A0A6A1USU0_9ROSI|nr:Guanine nucleotide-binding protein subunit gamma 1 [Morella rubra]